LKITGNNSRNGDVFIKGFPSQVLIKKKSFGIVIEGQGKKVIMI